MAVKPSITLKVEKRQLLEKQANAIIALVKGTIMCLVYFVYDPTMCLWVYVIVADFTDFIHLLVLVQHNTACFVWPETTMIDS